MPQTYITVSIALIQKTCPPMLDIGCLRPHEQIDPIRLEELKRQLTDDGYQKDPIIVDERHLIVIDGHHRILALKALGYSKVVAHRIKYLDDDRIVLKTWHPVVRGSRTELLNALYPYLEPMQEQIDNSREPTLVLDDAQYSLKASRGTIMDCLLGRFRMEYAPDAETARKLAKNEEYAGAIIFEPIGKEEVVRAALSGTVLPPKTTQHIVPDKPADWFIPLETLNNGTQLEPSIKRE